MGERSNAFGVKIGAWAVGLVVLASGSQGRAGLINGGFENYAVPAGTNDFRLDAGNGGIAGWNTTESDHLLEIWGTGFLGVPAYEGSHFAELNANEASTLYQDISGIAVGSLIGFQFAHRGRGGVDTMQLTITDVGADNTIGTADDMVLFQNQYSDGNTAWGFYTDATPLVALGNTIRFAYTAVSAAGGPTVGNFIDAADFGIGVGSQAVPEPSTLLLSFVALAGVGVSRLRRRA